MKQYVLFLLAGAALLAGCEKKAADEIDYGTIKDSVYENNYLGFSISIPTNWAVQDLEAQRQITKRGLSMVAGDDKNLKAALKGSEKQSVNLFSAFKYPPGSPVPNNAAIMGVAERVRDLPGIQRGRDYLYHAKQLLQSGQVAVSFPTEVYTEQYGGVDFDVMEVDLSMGNRTIKEKYYATIKKGYALSLVLVSDPQGGRDQERKLLETIKFK